MDILDPDLPQIAGALCSLDPKIAWTSLGFGSIYLSAERPDEHDVNVIVCPYIGGKVITQEAEVISLPAAVLGVIEPRSIWSNHSYSGERATRKSLTRAYIESKNQQLVRFGDIYPVDDILTGYPAQQLADSYCIKTIAHPWSGLPRKKHGYECYFSCNEIFRMYNGHSSQFINAVLSGLTATESLYIPERTFYLPGSGHFITLRMRIPDNNAPFAARVWLDNEFSKQFDNVHLHTFNTNSQSNDHYLISYLPFDESTNIDANIIFLDDGTIRITKIISCLSAFPFGRLLFNRENDGRTLKGVNPIEEFVCIPRQKASPDSVLCALHSPDITISTLNINIENTVDAFPKLHNTEIHKIEKATVKNNNIVRISEFTSDSLVEYLSTANKSGARNSVGQVTIKRKDPSKSGKGDSPAFTEAISLINESKNTTAHYIVLDGWESEHDPKLSHLPISNITANDIGKWYLICDDPDFKSEPFDKNCIIAMYLVEIKRSSHFFYLVEFIDINSRTHTDNFALLFSHGRTERLSQQDIISELQIYAENRSGWKNNSKLLLHQLLAHDKRSKPDQKKRNILKYIDKFIRSCI